MEAKFTPGPWHWVNPGTDEPREAGEYRSSLRTVTERDRGVGPLPIFILDADEICDTYPREGTQEANASLIAAAPDLYAACERALAFTQGKNKNLPLVVSMLTEALALARGESS